MYNCVYMKNQKNRRFSRQFSSYIFIGGLAFACEYILFLALIQLASSPLAMAQSGSFLLGLLVSFYGNRNNTFNTDEDYVLTGRTQLRRYVALALSNLLLTNMLIYVLVHGAITEPLVAKVLVMGCVVLWNYAIFSRFIFKTK